MQTADTEALDRFKDLFAVLEDLIKRVADTEDPTIRSMRAKVRAELVDLENDMTPIEQCMRRPLPERRPHWTQGRQERAWGQPALVAITGVAVALTLLGED